MKIKHIILRKKDDEKFIVKILEMYQDKTIFKGEVIKSGKSKLAIGSLIYMDMSDFYVVNGGKNG